MSPIMLHQPAGGRRSGPAAGRSGSLRSFNLELEHSQAASDAGSLCAESAPSEAALQQGDGEGLHTAAVSCIPEGVGHSAGALSSPYICCHSRAMVSACTSTKCNHFAAGDGGCLHTDAA